MDPVDLEEKSQPAMSRRQRSKQLKQAWVAYMGGTLEGFSSSIDAVFSAKTATILGISEEKLFERNARYTPNVENCVDILVSEDISPPAGVRFSVEGDVPVVEASSQPEEKSESEEEEHVAGDEQVKFIGNRSLNLW